MTVFTVALGLFLGRLTYDLLNINTLAWEGISRIKDIFRLRKFNKLRIAAGMLPYKSYKELRMAMSGDHFFDPVSGAWTSTDLPVYRNLAKEAAAAAEVVATDVVVAVKKVANTRRVTSKTPATKSTTAPIKKAAAKK
jgi:hypothetical protein